MYEIPTGAPVTGYRDDMRVISSKVVPRSSGFAPADGVKPFFFRQVMQEEDSMKVRNLVSKRFKETPADC